jgi:GTP-binding protein
MPAPLQLQISALDYSTFVGRIGVGRITQGTLKPGQDVLVMAGPDGKPTGQDQPGAPSRVSTACR